MTNKLEVIELELVETLNSHGTRFNTEESLAILNAIETAYKLGKREGKKIPKKKARKKNGKK